MWLCFLPYSLSCSQEALTESYFTSQRDKAFCNVEVVICVFDVESRDIESDMHYYQSCLEAKVFCLLHKMDLIPEEQRDIVLVRVGGRGCEMGESCLW